MGTVYKKFDCDFDPYVHARELIAEEVGSILDRMSSLGSSHAKAT